MRSTALIVLSALVLAGCSDDPASPTLSGSLSHSYTGAGATNATTFSASGSIPVNVGGSLGSSAWAAGSVEPDANFTFVGAVIPRTSTSWDITQVSIGRKTVGTSPIQSTCDSEAIDCTSVFMFFNFNPNGDTGDYFCALTSGSVSITAISSTSVAGTYSGTGTCSDENFVESSFSITGGTFNVPLTSQFLTG